MDRDIVKVDMIIGVKLDHAIQHMTVSPPFSRELVQQRIIMSCDHCAVAI